MLNVAPNRVESNRPPDTRSWWRIKHPFPWVMIVILAAETVFLVWLFAMPPSKAEGWTEVGNGTRLLYVDLPDHVRCYRRYYSSNLDCIQVKEETP
jgi:hypothetical protein